MSPTRRRTGEDMLGYALRVSLYLACIVFPFVALLTGRIEVDETVSAALALLTATGGTVALSRARTETRVRTSSYADGLKAGLTADSGPGGRHRLEDDQ